MSSRSVKNKREGEEEEFPAIKPSHVGLLHKKLGVPEGEKIPLEKIEKATHSKSPSLRKQAIFAKNFR